MWKVNRKRIVIILLVLGVLSTLVVWLALNVNIGMGTDSYAALSISFDKRAMRSADRIVLRTDTKEVEITDSALVSKIVDETAAATHMKLGCPEEKWIDVYCGDRLIRSMGWAPCADTVNVFDTDATHWIVTIEGGFEGGCIFLSAELADQLNALLEAA